MVNRGIYSVEYGEKCHHETIKYEMDKISWDFYR